MKVKSGLMLREIAGEWVVVPLGARVVELNGIITLTESGAFLWRLLEKGAEENELTAALLKEYDIDEATARSDIGRFLDTIRQNSLCEAEVAKEAGEVK
ncbi:MAG: PqqD family protein [Clostridiaceae bacterium]|nr:PqqD family protein [Clostridiaceae bacterium]